MKCPYWLLLVLPSCLLACSTSSEGNGNSADVDTTPPSTPAAPTDTGASTNIALVAFSWTAASDSESGVAGYVLHVGSSPGASDVFADDVGDVLSHSVAGENGQTLYARVQAVNGAGLFGDWSASSDGITVDTALPDVSITSPANGGTYGGTLSVTADVSDNLALDRVEFTLDASSPLASISSGPYELSLDTTTLSNADHTITATAFDAAGNSKTDSVTVAIYNDTAPPVIAITSPADGGTYSGTINVAADASDNVALDRVEFSLDGEALATDNSAPYSYDLDVTAIEDGNHIIDASAFDTSGNSSNASVTITIDNSAAAIPPDPRDVAPAIDPTVATTMSAATSFLYAGANPIQTGVLPGTIKPRQVAVLRGRVSERDGTPIEGVTLTILDHAEFGQTLTRTDGMFDMAVNGGGYLTVDYRREGYLPVQRRLDVPWQDYAWLPAVVMVPVDPQVTTLDLTSAEPIQVARGSVVTDGDGSRQAMLMVPQGTTATITLVDGSTQSINTLSFRATEYTVGDSGPAAMPGDLPPSSGYTYAVELSADEALTNGIKVDGKDVEFNQPVPFYVDSFLGFSTGETVPVGYYDNSHGAWVPYDNGLVIEIVSITNTIADIDVDGDGAADTGTALANLNITDAERQQLATLYAPGKSLWRSQLTHLSTWDCNWPYGPPDDAVPPRVPVTDNYYSRKKQDDPCEEGGSIIECQNQILGQRLAVTGTGFALNYRSDRMPGHLASRSIEIPLSGPSVPASLQGIVMRLTVAGRELIQSFPALPNQDYLYVWDGLDAYGRRVQGSQTVSISVGYVYGAVYKKSLLAFAAAFGLPGDAYTGNRARQTVTIFQKWQDTIGIYDAALDQQRGGWSLDPHHAYDPIGRRLYLGNGARRSAYSTTYRIDTVAGTGVRDSLNFSTLTRDLYGDGGSATRARLWMPQDLVVDRDDTLYISDEASIRRVSPDGIITTIAGTGKSGFSGDNGPAQQAQLRGNDGIAIGPDGSLYVADSYNMRIRRIAPDGIITTVAGNGQTGFAGDGGPATEAQLYGAVDVAVDADGNLYILDSSRIRRVGPDGIINTIAGDQQIGFSGDGGPATAARFNNPQSIAIGPDGSLYIADTSNLRVRRITPDGVIDTVAGNGVSGFDGDGGPATDAQLAIPRDIAVGADGSILIAGNFSIRRVGPDGIISTRAGNTTQGDSGDGGPAAAAQMHATYGIAIGPDDAIYIADQMNDRIRRVAFVLPGFTAIDSAIASADGNELYQFDVAGRHLRTLSTLTGATLYSFDYDSGGYLTGIVDGDGNTTTIERDSEGNPTAITAPGGQRTELLINGDGYIDRISNGAGEATNLTYTADGLLSSLTRPEGNSSNYSYDTRGMLILAEDAAAGFKAFTRTKNPDGYTVTMTTAMDRVTTYQTSYLATGEERSLIVNPNGAQTEVLVGIDGSTTITDTNGMVTTLHHGPDPRFGMEAPVLQSLVAVTPAGLTKTVAQTRTASLANSDDLLSLTALQNTVTVNGVTTTHWYDAATQSLTKTTPTGLQTVSQLDALGRATSVNLATGIDPITTSYDSQGLITLTSQGGQARSYGYDAHNRIVSRADAQGNTTYFSYDDADRITQVLQPNAETVAYSYDTNGNRTQVIMPSLDTHLFSFTLRDLVASYTPPNGTAFGRIYDLDKALLERTLPSGRSIVSTYDATTGQRTEEAYPEATVAFAYAPSSDRLASLTRTSSSGATQAVSYGYDGFLPTSQSWSGVAAGDFQFIYDDNFLLTQTTLDSGADTIATAFSYDADGMLTAYGPFSIDRAGPGGAPSLVSDDTSSLTFDYDSLARVSGRSQTANGNAIYSYALTRNSVGRIVQKVETIRGTSHTYGYSYDASGQLTAVTRDGATAESYSYDANGNRHGTPDLSLYDTQDRLISHDGVEYQFDADGYLTQRGGDTFQYSARGELLAAVVGGNTISYDYDGIGRRVGRTDDAGTTQYLYGHPANPFLVSAIRDSGGVLSSYYYDENGLLFAMQRGGSIFYVGTDQVGTPLVVADSSGGVVKVVEYDGFGKRLSDSEPAFELPFGFAGGLEDTTTGLIRFGMRDYDQASGRWVARDPLLFGGGQANLYVYVGNNPVSLRDPLGLWCIGGSYYFGFGAGVQLCSSDGDWSLCAQGGVGIGGSLDIGSGGVAETGDSVKAEAGVRCGALGIGVKCAYGSRCGMDCDLEAGIGPFGIDTAGEFKASDGPGAPSVRSAVNPKCGYQAKLAYEGCGQW